MPRRAGCTVTVQIFRRALPFKGRCQPVPIFTEFVPGGEQVGDRGAARQLGENLIDIGQLHPQIIGAAAQLAGVDLTGGEHPGQVVEPGTQRGPPGVQTVHIDALTAVQQHRLPLRVSGSDR